MQGQTNSRLEYAQVMFIYVLHICKLVTTHRGRQAMGLNENRIPMKRMCRDYKVVVLAHNERLADFFVESSLDHPFPGRTFSANDEERSSHDKFTRL